MTTATNIENHSTLIIERSNSFSSIDHSESLIEDLFIGDESYHDSSYGKKIEDSEESHRQELDLQASIDYRADIRENDDNRWELQDFSDEIMSSEQDYDKYIEEDERQAALFERLVRRTEDLNDTKLFKTEWRSFPPSVDQQSPGNSQASISEIQEEFLIEDDFELPEKRRERASSFLESLILNFYGDLLFSMEMITNQAKRQPSRALVALPRKRKHNTDLNELQISGLDKDGEQNEQLKQFGVNLRLKNRKSGVIQIIKFPGAPCKTSQSKNPASDLYKITCIIKVATILYEAILDRAVITLRDIFYRDKPLFIHQPVVNKIVDDIVASAGLQRKDFNVCASAKGLIAATSLVIHRRTENPLVLSATHASLIDPIEKISHLETPGNPEGIKWVLVVEKDAVFQSLCNATILKEPDLGSGVLVTGKGFPDLATRQILYLIANSFPKASMYALVDADPHGLSIFSNYTYGSKANAYSKDHAGIALGERLQWLGLKASDWGELGISYNDLIPLEKSDVQLAMSMLRNHEHLPTSWKRELCHMLQLNRKAEIEIILSSNDPFQSIAKFTSGSNHEGVSHQERVSGAGRLVKYIIDHMKL
ncbi:hypothetical protein L204_102406 [Cryptococcus depauperatus]